MFRKRDASFEIIQRLESAMFSFSLDLFAMFLAQSIYDTQPKSECVIVDNRATPLGLRDANRFDLEAVPLRIFYNRCRRVKAHWLIVNKACVKFRCAMHF